MSASKLDAVYRSILITKFFTKGWGKPDNLRRLFEFRKIVSDREECYKLIPSDYPITITKEEKRSDYHLLEGHFLTPLETLLPGVVPTCAQKAHFQVLMPPNWADSNYKPMCVHLAGTGDHFFWRRRNLMAKPLMKEAGIGAIILENPFYGLRKPQDQVRSSLHNVSDIFVMGGCLILETLVLLRWCERNGLGPLGVTGLSMGGHMASLAATNWPKPLVLVPCLSWSTASAVFTQGVMSNSINWELLETQFFSDGEYRNKLAKMVTIVDEAFLAGRKFAQRFSKNHNTSPAMDVNTFNLPAILNNTETLVNKIDITNPDNILSCQGFRPELNQKYSVINKSNETSTSIFNGTSLEILKNNQQLSEDLYMKITSQKKFELESSEITQINEIAYQSMESTLNHQKKIEIEGTKELGYRSIEPTLDNQKSAYSENICNSAESELVNVQNQLCKNIDREEKTSCLTIVEKDSEPCDNKITNIDNICDKIRQVKNEQSCKTSTELTLVNGENEKNTLNGLTKSILSSIPFLMKEKEDASIKWKNREALQFMRGVMDECTHLSNFSIPYDTSLIIAVCAKNDAYVPREDCGSLEDIWPGAEVRYIDAGHVSAYVLHQSLFRSCIVEAFEKSKKKWLEEKEKV